MPSRSPHLLFAGLLVFSLSSLAGAAAPRGPSNQTAPALRGDARLEQKVSVARRDTPLGELLAEIGKTLKVKLAASRDTLDDRTILFQDDRPALELLSQLARELDFRWFRTEQGYELGQDAECKRKEAAIRAAETSGQLAAIRARLDQMVKLGGTNPATLQARQEELMNRLRSPELTPEQWDSLADEMGAGMDLLRPGGAVVADLYRGLGPEQVSRLLAGEELRFSTAAGTLSPALAQSVYAARRQPPSRAPGLRGTASITIGPGAPDDNTPPTGAEVSLHLGAGNIMRIAGMPAARQLQLRVTLTTLYENAQGRRALPMMWQPSVRPPASAGAGERAPTRTEDPDLLRAVDLGLGEAVEPAAAPQPGGAARIGATRALGFFSLPEGFVTLGQVCEALHRVTGLQVLSDNYVRDRLDPKHLAAKGQPRPVVQILDTVAKELNYDWVKEGSQIRFRSRFWADDRAMEVPQRILKPWRSRVARSGAANLDDLSELAAALSDDQTAGMQDYWQWYLEGSRIPPMSGPDGFHASRHHLRLWAALTLPQKAVAKGGQVVPAAGMSNIQRGLFLRALLTPADGYGVETVPTAPSAQDVAAGGFSLTSTPMQRMTYSGTSPDGAKGGIVFQGIIKPGGAALPPPKLPDGSEIQLAPAGKPETLDNITFRYYLSGSDHPARTAMVMIPRAETREKE